INPHMIHYHYPTTKRRYPDRGSDYCRNMMTMMLCVGGQAELDWLYGVYAKELQDGYLNVYRDYWEYIRDASAHAAGKGKLRRLYEDALARGSEHSKYIASIRHRTLAEQLEKFRAEGIK